MTAVPDATALPQVEESPPTQWDRRSGGIGSRRRAGTETPTDSNATEWEDQRGAFGMASEFSEPLESRKIGSRRRGGDQTPTDSNATEGWDQDNAADIGNKDKGGAGKKSYTLTLAIANRSDEQPMRDFLEATEADIVFGQEVHVEGERFEKFRADGKLGGWKILGSEAVATGRGGEQWGGRSSQHDRG